MANKGNKYRLLESPPNSLHTLSSYLVREAARVFPDAKGFVVALSGGMDSTAVLRLFCDSDLKSKVSAVHLNYRLRGEESDGDQEFCEDLCSREGIALKTLTVEHAAPTTGIQEWARDLRRAEFEKWQKRGFIVVLGHHFDDLAETVLLRMVRGASAGHLVGMERCEAGIWRPLLHLGRADIAALTKQKKWDHREDSSNAKIKYSRNFIRHEVLPRLNQLYANVEHRLVGLARETRDLEHYCLNSLAKQLGDQPERIAADLLVELGEGVAFQAFRLMLRGSGEETVSSQIKRQLWRQIYDRIKTSQGQEIKWCFDLPHGLLFMFDRGEISVARAQRDQKRNRAIQHKQSLLNETQEAILGPGAEMKVFFDHPAQTASIVRNESKLTKLLTASNQNRDDRQLS